MRIHDELRRALSAGLHGDNLLEITRRIATLQGNGETARPIVLHTILTVLEGTWRRWFADYPTTVGLGEELQARLWPATEVVLAAEEGGDSDELLAALDALAGTYKGCIKDFPT